MVCPFVGGPSLFRLLYFTRPAQGPQIGGRFLWGGETLAFSLAVRYKICIE